jgi:hypothetical protein
MKFGEALASAPLWDSAGKGQGIATLIDSIKTLSRGVNYFNDNVNSNTFESTMSMLGKAFKTFGESLEAAPLFNSKERGEGISIVVDSISSLVEGLKKLDEIDGLDIENTLDALGTAIYNFGQAIGNTGGVLGIGVEKKAQSITIVINALGDLVPPLKEICKLQYDKVKNVLSTIGYSLNQYASAINSANWFTAEDNSEAISNIIKSIGGLTPTLKSLCALDYDTLKNVLFSLGYSLQQFVSAVNGLKWNSDDKADTLDSIINSIVKFGTINFTALNNVLNAMDKFIALIGNLNKIEFKDKSVFIRNLADVAVLASKEFEVKFKEAIPRISNAANDMLKAVKDKIKSYDVIFRGIGKDSSNNYIEGFKTNINLAYQSAKALADKVQDGLELVDFNNTGVQASKDYIDGLKENFDLSYQAGVDAAQDVIDGLKESFETSYQVGSDASKDLIDGLRSNLDDAYRIGEHAGDGFIDGLRSKMSEASEVGKSLARKAYEAAQRALQIHSPSKKMMQLGSYAGEGFVDGLYEWTRAALQAGKELGTDTTEGVVSSISEIQNGLDFNPVITPVLNLDNLKDEANKIGGILDLSTPIALANSANISFSGGISKMFDDLEASIPENSNDDVVEAVNNLSTNMMNVMRTLGQLQVVLDTGTMVGELVNPIDQALERNYVLSERGVR